VSIVARRHDVNANQMGELLPAARASAVLSNTLPLIILWWHQSAAMPFDLTEAEKFALLNLLIETIETSRYPFFPRVQTLKGILAKLGPVNRANDDQRPND
jgi:hypothetical protein